MLRRINEYILYKKKSLLVENVYFIMIKLLCDKSLCRNKEIYIYIYIQYDKVCIQYQRRNYILWHGIIRQFVYKLDINPIVLFLTRWITLSLARYLVRAGSREITCLFCNIISHKWYYNEISSLRCCNKRYCIVRGIA